MTGDTPHMPYTRSQLRGFDEPVRLFEVRWQVQGIRDAQGRRGEATSG